MQQNLVLIPVFVILLWLVATHVQHVARTRQLLKKLEIERLLTREIVFGIQQLAVSEGLLSQEDAATRLKTLFDAVDGEVAKQAADQEPAKTAGILMLDTFKGYLRSFGTFRGSLERIKDIFVASACIFTASFIVLMVIKAFE